MSVHREPSDEPGGTPDEASEGSPGAWVAAAPVGDVPAGSVVEVIVGDAIVAIVNTGDALHALDGLCAHQGGPLGRGCLADGVLTCPWHGWQYDVATGRQRLSRTIAQRVYPTRVVGDTIEVLLRNRGGPM